MSEQSERLLKAITNSGLTYIDLEKKTGIAKSSIQRYATGNTKKIPIDAVKLIADATNTSAAWIMGWEPDPSAEHRRSAKFDTMYETKNILSDLKHANETTFVMNGYDGRSCVTVQAPPADKCLLSGRGTVIDITESEFDALKVVLETMRPKDKNK